MTDHEFDRVFSKDGDLVPSSGFASSVIDSIRNEASAPPPIPFPWKRALPGFAAGVLALATLLVAVLRHPETVPTGPGMIDRFLASVTPAVSAAQMYGGGWILGSLLLSYLCVKLGVKLAMHFSRGRV